MTFAGCTSSARGMLTSGHWRHVDRAGSVVAAHGAVPVAELLPSIPRVRVGVRVRVRVGVGVRVRVT